MFTDKINKADAPVTITASPFFSSNTIQLQEAAAGNPCRFWNKDPQSLAVTVIKKYITEELKWSNVSVSSFKNCDTWDPDTKHWGCDFVLSNNKEGGVFMLEKLNRVRVQISKGPQQGNTFCFYNYTCNDKNEITFTKDNCG